MIDNRSIVRKVISPLLGLSILGTLISIVYLGVSLIVVGQPGLPLDDSWIHQALARNLAQSGMLWINPGEVNPVTTSFLWTLALALGYKLGINYLLWAYILGLVSYLVSAWLVMRLSMILFPEKRGLALLSAILFLLDWHLAWAAVSGMETMIFTMFSILLVYLGVRRERPAPIALGLVGALAMLSRPEGVALFALSLAFLWLRRIVGFGTDSNSYRSFYTKVIQGTKPFLGYIALAVFAFLLLAVPYWLFNFFSSGSPLPSTFQAKHAYYSQGVFSVYGVLLYLFKAAVALLVGPLLLLLPGVLYIAVVNIRNVMKGKLEGRDKNSLLILLPLAWVGLLWLMYFVWLPVPHLHHGRYLMPSMPFLLVLGLAGSAELAGRLKVQTWLPRLRTVVLAFSTMWLIVGAMIYACNVKFIQDNQVAAALWVKDNTALDSEIATHDIGAMGYFSERRLLDTVGLITPELSYRPGNEAAVVSLMQGRGVDTMILFPSWHPWVLESKDFTEIARMGGECLLFEHSESMMVMRFIRK